MIAIKGSLAEASLADVLQLLAMEAKTGCLSLTQEKNFASIYFDGGRICYASIVNRRDRIGERLVRAGVDDHGHQHLPHVGYHRKHPARRQLSHDDGLQRG